MHSGLYLKVARLTSESPCSPPTRTHTLSEQPKEKHIGLLPQRNTQRIRYMEELEKQKHFNKNVKMYYTPEL